MGIINFIMRIGLISDIHGNSLALEAVLNALSYEVEQILFLGDLCGYYPFVEECASLWNEDRMVGVRGNHDQVLLSCLQYGMQPSIEYQERYGSALKRTLQNLSSSSMSLLQSLPLSRTLKLNGAVFALYHGAPWDPLEGRVYPDFDQWERFSEVPEDIILLGHTHYPLVNSYRGKIIVNPGSVGQPRDHAGKACFAILNVAAGEVQHRRVSFDARKLIEDAREYDPNLPYLEEVLTRR